MVTPNTGHFLLPPHVLPLGLGPPRGENCCVGKDLSFYAGKNVDMKSLLQLKMVGARLSRAATGKERPFIALVLFFACLLSGALARERGLYTLFFAGLQVEGVTFNLLDDVFLLHLAFEAA